MAEGQALKRRGILAAAGAVVAAMMPKSPVEANTGGNLILGKSSDTGGGNLAEDATQIAFDGIGTVGGTPGTVLLVSSRPDVHPSSLGFLGAAIIGTSDTTLFPNGVAGYSSIEPDGIGVLGYGNRGKGVYGYGLSIGVQGYSAGANSIAVYGGSVNGAGVVGVTQASYQYGVLGQATAVNSTGIAGACTANGSSAISGGTTNPNAYAAFFQGTTVVQGNFAVTGNKAAALAHPDGSHRLVYCVESPESWIEDVGTSTLTNGAATVTFDKDFTSVVHTDAYHVFLTEYDDNNALYVTKKTPTGFAVHAKGNASANGLFSWRVMVKRSDVQAERLGKFVMPNLPLPDSSKFKAPETPMAATPRKP